MATISSDISKAAGALLMAATAADLDATGEAIPRAIAAVYGGAFDELQVETGECGGGCPAMDRALDAVGAEFGRILSAQMVVQLALLARLAAETGRSRDELLREILDL